MKIYDNIEQRTQEWHQLRYGKIGGTLSSSLFSTPAKIKEFEIEMASYQLEEFTHEEEGYISDAMQRGIDLEPYALRELSSYASVEFNQVGWVQSLTHDLFGISPDGLSGCTEVAAEIKCLGRKAHTMMISGGEIDKGYIFQCVHYFTVIKSLKMLYFCAYRPESYKKLEVRKITNDTVFNIGTDAKPVNKSVAEIVEISRNKHDALLTGIDNIVSGIKGGF